MCELNMGFKSQDCQYPVFSDYSILKFDCLVTKRLCCSSHTGSMALRVTIGHSHQSFLLNLIDLFCKIHINNKTEVFPSNLAAQHWLQNINFLIEWRKYLHDLSANQDVSEALIWTSCPSSLTHIDDECEWLSEVVFNQLLFVGGEELRVLHILQQEVTFVKLPFLFLWISARRWGAVSCVEDSIQEELHWGLLRLAGRRGCAGDCGHGEHCTSLQEGQRRQISLINLKWIWYHLTDVQKHCLPVT